MKRNIYKYILIVFFASITIVGIYQIIHIVKNYKTSTNTYNNIKQYVNNNYIDDIKEENLIWPQVDFTSLKKINNDIIGWISIDNLNISYPIVQGTDNDYYLNHLVDNTYNSAGSIFMDYRNDYNLNDKNTIIYGHNMKDGSMFSKLLKYKDQKYFDENPFYILITPNKKYKVEILAVYVANVNDPSWQITFSNDDEFSSWLNNTLEKSLFSSRIKPTTNDQVITLSTCSNTSNDTRFVLVGILREYIS